MNIHAVVIDSRALFRSGIVRLLASDTRIDVVDEATTLGDALHWISPSALTVVLIEWSLIRGQWDSILHLRTAYPAAKVLLFDIPDDDAMLLHALRSGAHGLIDEHSGFEFVLQAVLRLAAGGTVVAPRLAQQVVNQQYVLSEDGATHLGGAPLDLTEREFGVLRVIAAGFTNRQAAQLLGISEHTVRAHLRSLSRKLGAHNRVEATSKAIQIGLLARPHRAEKDSA